jgi:hypothetical protein
MQIYLVEADPNDVDEIRDQWVFRRAVVVSINEEAAIQCVVQGLRGAEIFTGFQDEGRYSRPADSGYINEKTCTALSLGKEPHSKPSAERRSRILCWELCGPEAEVHEDEDHVT